MEMNVNLAKYQIDFFECPTSDKVALIATLSEINSEHVRRGTILKIRRGTTPINLLQFPLETAAQRKQILAIVPRPKKVARG